MTADPIPPAYTADSDGASSDSDLAAAHLPAGVKPCNFVQVKRPKPIVGVWVVDPSMKMPIDIFPLSVKQSDNATNRSPGEKKNLELECTASWAATGSILADVFVLPSTVATNPKGSKRTTITLNAPGWIKLRLHDSSPEVKNEHRLPIAVELRSSHAMKLYLPRSFCGPLHLRAQRRVWYSSAVRAQLTPLSEVDGNHMAFLGSMDPSLWEGWQKWNGDSASGDAGATVIDVYFDDEDIIPTTDNNCICM